MSLNVSTSSTAAQQTQKPSTRQSSSKDSKAATFEIISQEQLLSLYEQRKGTQYFIPEGFEPVLIPSGTQVQPVANLVVHARTQQQLAAVQQQQQQRQAPHAAAAPVAAAAVLKSTPASSSSAAPAAAGASAGQFAPGSVDGSENAASTSTSAQVPSSSAVSSDADVRFPSLVLTRNSGQAPKSGSASSTKVQKPKKPPRPPNAFILYRRSKQPAIVAANEGISNNEVSKQVGEMWHREPLEEKLKFQKMAEQAKAEHMKKYPEYKYRPRRPHEKRRRTKRPSLSNGNPTTANGKVNVGANAQIAYSQHNASAVYGVAGFPALGHFDEPMRRDSVCTNDAMFDFDNESDSRRDSYVSVDETTNFFDSLDPTAMAVLSSESCTDDHAAQVTALSPLEGLSPHQSPQLTDLCTPSATSTIDDGYFTNLSMMEGISESDSVVPFNLFEQLNYATHPEDVSDAAAFGYFGFEPFDLTAFINPANHGASPLDGSPVLSGPETSQAYLREAALTTN